MRTECPDCQTAFRVTAAVLRQAHGQVRCGDCGHVFDALDYLFEDPPDAAAAADDGNGEAGAPGSAIAGLLDDLHGDDDVRIEDTGVEWRVLDVRDADGDADSDAANSDEAPAGEGTAGWMVERPLDLAAIDDGDADEEAAFAEAGDVLAVGRAEDDSDNDAALPVEEPGAAQDRAESSTGEAHEEHDDQADDRADEQPDDEQHDNEQHDVDQQHAQDEHERSDSDSDDAQQMRFDDNTPLPAEYDEPQEPGAADRADTASAAADDTDADEEALRVSINTGTEEDWRALLDEVEATPAAIADDDADATTDAAADRPDDEEGDAGAAHAENVNSDDDATADDDDTAADAALADTAPGDDDAAAVSPAADAGETEDDTSADDTLVESIVMEGETVTDLLERAEQANYDDVPPPEFDDDTQIGAVAEDRKGNGRLGRIAGYAAILLLVLALAAQLVHANREVLATQPLFQQSVAPVYEALGMPVQPAWNVRGWQFESTSGSTDAAGEHLVIYSTISNHSTTALPYPLLHVSLTDRFDEVIGSRILTPGEYLAGERRTSRPVRAGGDFTAVITVHAPSTAATGFKLNVCYPMHGASVRCAIEDFRD